MAEEISYFEWSPEMWAGVLPCRYEMERGDSLHPAAGCILGRNGGLPGRQWSGTYLDSHEIKIPPVTGEVAGDEGEGRLPTPMIAQKKE